MTKCDLFLGAYGLKVALMHPKQGHIPSGLSTLLRGLQKNQPVGQFSTAMS
jgi:hypothetical protein